MSCIHGIHGRSSLSKERKHERSALLVTLPELIDELRVNNGRERSRELTEALGWKWRLCSRRELGAAFPYEPSHLATVTYPWRLEQSHAMLVGTTGMGKTVAMSDMIAEARAKGQRCVVFDLSGAFIEHFHDPRRDIILNPLDARCPHWSLFDECRSEGEFWAAAEALVPHDGGGEAQFWVIAARALFVDFCLKLVAEGRGSNDALARELMTADLSIALRNIRPGRPRSLPPVNPVQRRRSSTRGTPRGLFGKSGSSFPVVSARTLSAAPMFCIR